MHNSSLHSIAIIISVQKRIANGVLNRYRTFVRMTHIIPNYCKDGMFGCLQIKGSRVWFERHSPVEIPLLNSSEDIWL